MDLSATKTNRWTGKILEAKSTDDRYSWSSSNYSDEVWDNVTKQAITLAGSEFEIALNALRVFSRITPPTAQNAPQPCPKCGTFCNSDCGR
jgi:CO dehydrogenase/acetyl-CoA synthase delta subunit